MAIAGLTDQQAAFPIIGELRKGAAKKGNAPGKDLDYFRFTSQDQEVVRAFYDAYPEQPRQINVVLPHATAGQNFDAWMEEWVAGGLVHRCDGRVCKLWRTDDGSYSTEPKACPGNCKQVGRLSAIVVELGRLATVTILTTSIHDIKNLMAQLKSYEALRGDLRGIPFVVSRKPRRVSVPLPDGKRGRMEKWLLSIESQPEWTKCQMLSMEQEALPEVAYEEPEPIAAEYAVLASGLSSPFDEEGTEPEDGSQAVEPESAPEPEPELKAKKTSRPKKQTSKSTKQTSTNGNHDIDPARPYSPDQLREKVRAFTAACKANGHYHDPETGEPLPIKLHPFGERTPQLLAAKMQEALDGDKDVYHKVLDWFFFNATANELKAVEAAAMFRILFNGSQELGFKLPVLEVARVELAKVYELVMEEVPF